MKRALTLGGASVLLAACGGGGGSDADPVRTIPGDVGSAPYAPGRGEVCELVPADAPSVTEDVADRDSKVLGDQLLADDNGVRSVSVEQCGTTYVVQVGVASRRVKVPCVGPGGTPVVTHRQRPVYAF